MKNAIDKENAVDDTNSSSGISIDHGRIPSQNLATKAAQMYTTFHHQDKPCLVDPLSSSNHARMICGRHITLKTLWCEAI